MSNENKDSKILNDKDAKLTEPVNNNVLKEEEAKAEDAFTYDARSIGDNNISLMSKETEHKLMAMLGKMGRNMDTFGSETSDSTIFPYAPRDLGISVAMQVGQYTTGKKDKDNKNIYASHIGLPATVKLSDPNDWKKSIKLTTLQLIDLSLYLTSILEAHRPAVSYYAAVERDAIIRKMNEKSGF